MAVRGKSLARALALLTAFVLCEHGDLRAQTADLVDRSALRVCADPANLPFSNKKREGFENKLAELLGEKLGVPVLYTWFPQAMGFVRNTLRARKCDIIMGFSQGHELVQNTNHYYRSTYVMIVPAASPLKDVAHIGDARLKGKRIGVVAGTPPATLLALNDLLETARPFQLMVDRRFESPAEKMVEQIVSGALDAGLLWGPICGYYAKQSETPLAVIPLTKEKKGPRMAYRITFGVRLNEKEWKRQPNRLIAKHQDEIHGLLLGYGVPLLDEQDKLIARGK